MKKKRYRKLLTTNMHGTRFERTCLIPEGLSVHTFNVLWSNHYINQDNCEINREAVRADLDRLPFLHGLGELGVERLHAWLDATEPEPANSKVLSGSSEDVETLARYDTPRLEKWAREAEEGFPHEAAAFRKAIKRRKTRRKWLKVQLFVGDYPGNWYISDTALGCLKTILEDVKELHPGDSFKITAVEMTMEEVDALGEFTGF